MCAKFTFKCLLDLSKIDNVCAFFLNTKVHHLTYICISNLRIRVIYNYFCALKMKCILISLSLLFLATLIRILDESYQIEIDGRIIADTQKLYIYYLQCNTQATNQHS